MFWERIHAINTAFKVSISEKILTAWHEGDECMGQRQLYSEGIENMPADLTSWPEVLDRVQ